MSLLPSSLGWHKDGGGFIFRTTTRFVRVWPVSDGRWAGVARAEPFVASDPKWEPKQRFAGEKEARVWAERGK